MSQSDSRRWFLVASLFATALPVCAHAASTDAAQPPQTVAAIPLDAAASGFAMIMQAHAQVLRPAPLPDQDVSAPGLSGDALAAQADPSLEPGLFNPQTHFAGDGYAPGSAIETDQNHRHSTGGGMNLSIPVE